MKSVDRNEVTNIETYNENTGNDGSTLSFNSDQEDDQEAHENMEHTKKDQNSGDLFPCSMCDMRYTRKCGLKRHMRTKHGNKRFSCKHCDKVYTTSYCLKVHAVRDHKIAPEDLKINNN